MDRKKTVLLIIIAALALSSLAVASDIGFKAANLRLGYVSPEGAIESTIGFGGGVDLGTIGKINSEVENVGWETVIFYWSKSYDAGVADWKYSDLAIKTNLKYYFPAEQVNPYIGAGLGIHMFSWEWDRREFNGFPHERFDQSDTKLGLHLLGGLEYPVSDQVGIFGELEVDLVNPDQLLITAGASMRFGP